MACVAVEQARAGGERRALDAELDADVGGGRRADDAQQRQRVRGALVLDEQVAIGLLEGDEAAGARADDAGRAVGIGERHLEARLLHRLVGGGGGEPRVAVGVHDDLVALEVLQPRLGIEVLDLGGDQDLQILERKAAELGDAALAGLDAGPELGDVEADRRDDAHAGHDDAAAVIARGHIALSWLLVESIRASAARSAGSQL